MSWTKTTTKMYLKKTGSGKGLSYPGRVDGTYTLVWESADAQQRIPREETKTYPALLGFTAAGKRYLSIKQLTAQQEQFSPWAKDVYGRDVFCVWERFPTFDSYDALYEHRYFHWFLIREGNELTRVQHTDESGKIYVTEDVARLETKCWDALMKETDWVK